MLCRFLLQPLPNTHSVSRGAGIGGSNNVTPGASPRALQEVHQTLETHQLFTCTVPQRLTGTVVFTGERVNGEECAQATALFETKKGAMPQNCLPDASRQALHTHGLLKSPLETPEPHVRGGTSMFHTIGPTRETRHDARMYFLLMGLEASFVNIACLSPRPHPHRRPQGCQQTQNGWSPLLLSVRSQR